ncbi:MAG: alcohol dehydrogenase catalytic domain-containing protein, partial [Bacteroidota bacterium]
MRAIGFKQSLPIDEANSFIEFETTKPKPKGYDILVKVTANAINPVDFKIRQTAAKDELLDTPKIIGWDAVGTVAAVGENVSRFKVGDEVFYA